LIRCKSQVGISSNALKALALSLNFPHAKLLLDPSQGKHFPEWPKLAQHVQLTSSWKEAQ
jgi:hypothetical protein